MLFSNDSLPCQVLGRDLDVGSEIRWKFEHAPLSAESRKTLDPMIAYKTITCLCQCCFTNSTQGDVLSVLALEWALFWRDIAIELLLPMGYEIKIEVTTRG